jgi:hypothetical protein
MTVLIIDPGETVGWALFDDWGTELGRGKMPQTLFWHSIHYKPQRSVREIFFTPRNSRLSGTVGVDEVVYESFYLDPGVKQGGSTGPAQEVIGVLKYLCAQAGIEPTAQRSAILPVAMKHCGYQTPLTRNGKPKHLPDEDSAWLHGMHYFIGEGIISPPHDVSATL